MVTCVLERAFSLTIETVDSKKQIEDFREEECGGMG